MTRKPVRQKAGKPRLSTSRAVRHVLAVIDEAECAYTEQDFLRELRKRGYRIVRTGRKK